MKKIGFIVFILTLVIGVAVAGIFSFGRITNKIFSFNVNFSGEKGSGNIQTQRREVSGFKAINVGGAFEVEIVAQKEFSVEVEADDNLLELIKTEVDGETLEISSEKRFSTRSPMKIRIGAPDIENLELSGASKVSMVGVNNDSLRVESSGASKIKVEGATRNLVVDMSGASKLDAENLKTENATIDSSGASSAYVFVSNNLKADLSGASNVVYSGKPTSIEKKTSGASCVKEK